MFFKGSRYENVENAVHIDEQGREIKHKKIRFIKETPAFFEHTVTQGERLDLISSRYHRDPTKFWLICDANNIMDPQVAEAPGKRLLIPLGRFR